MHLYTPLVYRWCRQAGLQEADALDVGQEVFRAVADRIAEFQPGEGATSFRRWLRTIAYHKLSDFARRAAAQPHPAGGTDAQLLLEQLVQDESASVDADTEQQDRMLVYRRAVELLLADCTENTRQAFWRVVVERQGVKEVALDLGMSPNAIYVLKSRLLRRLRQEFDGCVES